MCVCVHIFLYWCEIFVPIHYLVINGLTKNNSQDEFLGCRRMLHPAESRLSFLAIKLYYPAWTHPSGAGMFGYYFPSITAIPSTTRGWHSCGRDLPSPALLPFPSPLRPLHLQISHLAKWKVFWVLSFTGRLLIIHLQGKKTFQRPKLSSTSALKSFKESPLWCSELRIHLQWLSLLWRCGFDPQSSSVD